MEILGIGPLEVLFILVIVLIIFGPKDIVKAGKVTGKFLRNIVKSPAWQTVQKTSSDLRNLPNKLIREAGLEEVQEEINQIKPLTKAPDLKKEFQKEFNKIGEGLSTWTSTDPGGEKLNTKNPENDIDVEENEEQ
jgi:Sec-independent protein translocase protein TatA